ncbi:hypothetical protein LB465_10685 [Salegentibacter sp. LM13S]|uniref:hypothetical protein n=1 Tax=Salegentibacter lacus TaxID=2873599 RepID=UPI001CCC6159|nr:hypothetical protein [Salegentibacter lacus]MBZ9631244.1 hypothetical protein [Salegentibacter lacus]
MYKVLWFDDKYETTELIADEALLKDIRLIGYTNAKDGIVELEESYKEYDAVLLDGLFYENADQRGTELDDNAFGQVAKALSNLRAKQIFMPWYILSGQKKFRKGDSPFIKLFKDESYAEGKIFDKNKDEDIEKLWAEIKDAADKRPQRKARLSNPEIFKIFEKGCLPEEVEDQVLKLLAKPLPSDNSELKAVLTNIRSVQESIFLKLASIRVIPNNINSTNQKIKHLSGNISARSNWQATTAVYQNPEIENLQRWIYFTCGSYIHHLESQHYDQYMISNYAIESLKMGLMELLLWFEKIYKENI